MSTVTVADLKEELKRELRGKIIERKGDRVQFIVERLVRGGIIGKRLGIVMEEGKKVIKGVDSGVRIGDGIEVILISRAARARKGKTSCHRQPPSPDGQHNRPPASKTPMQKRRISRKN